MCRAWTIENTATVARLLNTAQGPFGYNLHGLKCEIDNDSVTTYIKDLTLTLNRRDFAAFTFHPFLLKSVRSSKPKVIKKAGCKKTTF